MKLWKLNERTGYWEYQRDVTPETADEWRRRFQIDEPTGTFQVSKMKPIPPTLRQAVRREHQAKESDSGLAVEKRDVSRTPWRIVHLASGLPLGTSFKTARAASQGMRAIASLTDWKQPSSELDVNRLIEASEILHSYQEP